MKKNLPDLIGDKLIYLNGGMYSNKNDPNFLVPKEPPGMSWNVNFGNPKAVRSFIMTILIIIGLVVASIALN
jgi:uncharacterized membrane protein